MTTRLATLAGGCLWCLETGTTGHAEVVQVAFDPEQLSYRDLLGVFFTLHDPTTLDRQGGDVGTQYRKA